LNIDTAYAVDSVILKLPQNLGMEFRWKIRSILQKFKSSRPLSEEVKAMSKDINMLQADKGS
jgi:hypothetical protein